MKIYLLDRNPEITAAWSQYFNEPDVEIVCDDFERFMDTHPEIDGIVSPANSFGIMTGGYDFAISKYCGWTLMNKVQKYIKQRWYGEQPVGTCMVVGIPPECQLANPFAQLLHSPTMRSPERIKDPRVIYNCMRSTLIEAENAFLNDIVIPAFGGDCGQVDPKVIASMMYLGYKSLKNPPEELDWAYAAYTKHLLEEGMQNG